MSHALEHCVRCRQSNGAGPQPWGKVPAWVWLCDECAGRIADLSVADRVVLAMRRMPFSAEGVAQIAAVASMATSTARRHLKALDGQMVRRAPHFGWWTLTNEGRTRAHELAGDA